jgi:hypothetical protein
MKRINIFIVVFLALNFHSLSAQSVWTQKSNHLGSPRYDFAGFSLNGKGYFGGGRYGGPFNAISEWQEYNPVSDVWNIITAMPYPFTGLSAFAAGGFGYIANGVNDAFYNYDTYKYNQAGNNWSTLSTMSYPRLYAANADNGANGFIIGGYGFMAEAMGDLWEYDPVTDIWIEKAHLPVGAERYYATAFSVNGNIFVFGGTNGSALLNDLWKYSPILNEWTAMSPLPGTGRQQCLSFVLNDEAYIIGGTPESGQGLKEVWNYQASNDIWRRIEDFPGINAPFGGIGFPIAGKGYIIPGNGTTESWEFDPGITEVATPEKALLHLSLYPNPVTDISTLSIQFDHAEQYLIELFDSHGQMIKSVSTGLSQIIIDRSAYNKGLYFIRVQDNNKKSGVLKFLIL